MDAKRLNQTSSLWRLLMYDGSFCPFTSALPRAHKTHFQEEQKRLGKAGCLMEGNDLAEHFGWRFVLEDEVRVNRDLDAIWNVLGRLIMVREAFMGPILNAEGILHFCVVIHIIRDILIFLMRSGPSFQLVFARIAAVLGFVECAYLICALLSDLPWPIFVACTLMLAVLFKFILN